jgi:hypothetical protein
MIGIHLVQFGATLYNYQARNKNMSKMSSDVIISEKRNPAGTLHNLAKGLVPLFATDRSLIRRCLALLAAICC